MVVHLVFFMDMIKGNIALNIKKNDMKRISIHYLI